LKGRSREARKRILKGVRIAQRIRYTSRKVKEAMRKMIRSRMSSFFIGYLG
jgi:hypothetical protein